MADDSKILTLDDYSDPFPEKVRGKYTVSVSIPRPIRHLFANGKATTKRYVAGKTLEDYERKKRSLSNKIYSEFDNRQREAELAKTEGRAKRIKSKQNLEDFHAENKIWGMMDSFPSVLTRAIKDDFLDDGSFVDWTTDIPYQSLLTLKNNMDALANMVWEAHPKDRETLQEAMDYFWEHNVIDNYDGEGGQYIREPDEDGYKDWEGFQYKVQQRNASADYLQPEVRSFLEDLLIKTAFKQNIETPVFDDPEPEGFWNVSLKRDIENYGEEALKKEYRQRRMRRTKVLTFSSVRDDYLAWCEGNRAEKSQSMRNKLRQSIDEFISYMGDPELSKLHPAMPIEFAEAQIANHPDRSRRVIRDRNWAMSHFCQYFGLGRRLVSSNPFQGAGVGIYGLAGKHWLEYSDEDLDVIFDHPWESQERLLLEFALATGMRLNEIASLTWERILSSNRYDYITLKDRYDLPNQTVKNEGSKRDIPLHPSLRGLEKATGRIFDYAIDGYGYATTSAGRTVNPILRQLIPNPQKSFHSFRSTFIIKLTETGCDTFTNRAIAGHGGRNANESVYNAVKNDTRFEAIEKLRLKPWLNRVPKDLLETKEN
ncbi:tyrosine-type recombinase/integrase [Paracoccaceae bacterium]|nr:tyrosine-type recombinase/integrase [Paracoccaceae bacterium]